jgi:hypothetical protein
MHYKNGREAKNGDKVVLLNASGNPIVVGILYDAVAGNDYCNGRIAPTSPGDTMPNLKECLRADDVGHVRDQQVITASDVGDATALLKD